MYVFLSILKYLAMCSGKAITSVVLKKKKEKNKERNKKRQTKTRILF